MAELQCTVVLASLGSHVLVAPLRVAAAGKLHSSMAEHQWGECSNHAALGASDATYKASAQQAADCLRHHPTHDFTLAQPLAVLVQINAAVTPLPKLLHRLPGLPCSVFLRDLHGHQHASHRKGLHPRNGCI